MKSPTRIARGAKARKAGRRAEWWATLWLLAKGYWPIARNLRTPFGEIDLVARRGRVLVFVEVKSRGTADAAAEALAWEQRNRILRAGVWFVGRRPDLASLDRRCDLVLVTPGRWPRHLVDAWGDDAPKARP